MYDKKGRPSWHISVSIKNNLKDLHIYHQYEYPNEDEDRVVAPLVGFPCAS